MSSNDRHDLQLEALLDEIDRSIMEASDAEVLQDARLAGVDPTANAKELKQRFLNAARAFQKRKLTLAKQAYAENVKHLSKRRVRIPASASEQRDLLQLTIAQHAQQGLALTAKYRDFESIPDSDLPELLQELAALHLLANDDEER
jgi:hypothetical protein